MPTTTTTTEFVYVIINTERHVDFKREKKRERNSLIYKNSYLYSYIKYYILRTIRYVVCFKKKETALF